MPDALAQTFAARPGFCLLDRSASSVGVGGVYRVSRSLADRRCNFRSNLHKRSARVCVAQSVEGGRFPFSRGSCVRRSVLISKDRRSAFHTHTHTLSLFSVMAKRIWAWYPARITAIVYLRAITRARAPTITENTHAPAVPCRTMRRCNDDGKFMQL